MKIVHINLIKEAHFMKNSDVIKSILLTSINELAADSKKFAVNPGNDFTRNRKMGFEDTVLMLLTMEADCIKEEIYRYFGRSIEAPSKSAFYKQRSKLNRQALANLLYIFNAKLSKKLYKGKYQLIACDGSTVEIFHNPNDPDTYYEPNGKSKKGYNHLHILLLIICWNISRNLRNDRNTDEPVVRRISLKKLLTIISIIGFGRKYKKNICIYSSSQLRNHTSTSNTPKKGIKRIPHGRVCQNNRDLWLHRARHNDPVSENMHKYIVKGHRPAVCCPAV